MDKFAALAIVPLLAIFVSAVYFFAAPKGQNIWHRLAVSAHGITIAILFISAMALYISGYSDPRYAIPFICLLLLPIGLIGYSVCRYKGESFIHGFQLFNVISLVLTFFIGVMAVTGDWV